MGRALVLSTLLFFGVSLAGLPDRVQAAESPVQFDLPSVAVAYHLVELAESRTSTAPLPNGWRLVTFELRLSCINTSTLKSPMQQFVVRAKPRDSSLQIVDYSPRTEVVSDLTTPIQIKRTNEKSNSLGLALNGNYGTVARGNIGTDQGTKDTECVQFDRAAPLQAVIASGTFERGRGVYFKLRWTDTQVLEGERLFRMTISVPPTWRGELVDVNVVGEAEHRPFGSWESELKTVASANFVVATYLHDDAEAASLAHRLANAEYDLRAVATRNSYPPKSLTGMLRQVTMMDSPAGELTWLPRILQTQSDPGTAQLLHQLPVEIRSVAANYMGVRRNFLALRDVPESAAVARVSINE